MNKKKAESNRGRHSCTPHYICKMRGRETGRKRGKDRKEREGEEEREGEGEGGRGRVVLKLSRVTG